MITSDLQVICRMFSVATSCVLVAGSGRPFTSFGILKCIFFCDRTEKRRQQFILFENESFRCAMH